MVRMHKKNVARKISHKILTKHPKLNIDRCELTNLIFETLEEIEELENIWY